MTKTVLIVRKKDSWTRHKRSGEKATACGKRVNILNSREDSAKVADVRLCGRCFKEDDHG